jgi:glyoxylase-like metal-dependent hydrolase (beta-lactamase superfamily II)
LLVESDAGLVLVDTGLGAGNINGERRLPGIFSRAMRPQLRAEEAAVEQVKALGFSPEDVRHIIATHLDLDHAGGLPDFPDALVHVHQREKDAALGARAYPDTTRYRAPDWAHEPQWRSYETDGEVWRGFESVRKLDGLGPEFLLIPLHGHSHGHSGVAVESEDGWILHAGDAYFHHSEIQADPKPPMLIKTFQRLMAVDDSMRLANQERLRDLAVGGDVTVICSHDQVEFERRRRA